ncbi:MAG: 50S ribosomal protein L10 [Crocinitomicaceae bacterium]|nr:50S ribosomal protein L10 [Crocinitomicaceae bacterium]|tara:strand:+ start:7671 stop:8195 length:525 start_codon:yes stop_codon:yes gene_type:complete
MTKEEKTRCIEDLAGKLTSTNVVYLADVAGLDAEATSKLRRLCFNKEVGFQVVKNTLLRKAMERVEDRDYSELFDVLKGNTSLMTAEFGNTPAKLIKEFRTKQDKPILKGAWIEETVFVGDNQLSMLADLKSKNELIAEVVALLQSPAKNVVSALQSGGSTLSGVVKTLSERPE